MYLNTEQTRAVAAYLRTLGPLSATRRDELLDHLCCTIETAMTKGLDFPAAFAECRERWNENEVKKIHSSTQNSFSMLKLIGTMLLFTGSLTFFSAPYASPPEKVAEAEVHHHQPPLITDTARPVPVSVSVEEVPPSDYQKAVQITKIEPPAYCPLEGVALKETSGFGMRIHPVTKQEVHHRGVDWRAPEGSPVQAGGNGTVLEAGEKGKYGKCIIIVHDEVYQTLYAHLSEINVNTGDQVTAGQTIGAVGNTGASLGPHLHYEVLKNGVPVNPTAYLP